ncbi:ring-1,2-phenylacetyl-CoA epoxidase subunit PaaE [Tenacibaculum skagerrakense]|uniref:Ring-1,2-phenylacetyl-CoA epoxidase subunit PaaE n=1 Tax=Tenacibaculum skagerrakense TaxID=186571 RepID=A0A4R2NQG2_9FLAO|nr:ferredoxin--NADP reductase [Tenacibaculum skagerrakense]TCP23912.1 ring-1,2-phenylacetyl-CoA epoxidase subunit PaaE [Tenacibaculum skagerrakense]
MSQFYTLKIKEVIRETVAAVSLVFDIPANLKSEFTFVAGQYITLKTTINGEEVRRAYSLCSSPNSTEVKVTVKAVENGTFSVFANETLRAGDELEVSKPEGKFVLQPEANKNYIGFAAGSGITPVLSMIKSVLETEPSASFTLVYGNKSVNDTIFYEELNSLKDKYAPKFNLNFVFSRESKEGSVFGRIDKAHVNYFLKNIYKEINFDKAFLCGPEEMITTVSETLTENGFAKDAILFELFTASIDEAAASQVKDGQTQVDVMLDGETISFTMSQDKDILSESLRNNVDAPYSCQGGVCSSCIAKITEGKAVMVKNQILTDAELEEGFILTCQAHPTTSKITVDFDDV